MKRRTHQLEAQGARPAEFPPGYGEERRVEEDETTGARRVCGGGVRESRDIGEQSVRIDSKQSC